jgi:hypothetical protein
MPLITNATGVQLEVDPLFDAARMSVRPLEPGTGGHYQFAKRTGTMAAALAANAVVFSFRWGSSTHLAVIEKIRLYFQPLAVYTAHQEITFEAYVARSFTASHTGGTAGTFTGNNGKTRTSHPTSQIATNGDVRISSTAALAGGTLTIDADPFDIGLGSPNIVNAAAGTAYPAYNRPVLEHIKTVASGEHPIILAQNEGIVIRNAVAWGAAGTAVLSVEIVWAEVQTY